MNFLEDIVIKFSTLFNINLLSTAYKGIGIAPRYYNLTNTFFTIILPKYLQRKGELVFFDVGANVGEVANQMLVAFDNCHIHCFEPNPHTFKKLNSQLHHQRVTLNNVGLGEHKNKSTIFYYENDWTTGHASIFKNVFEIHGRKHLNESPIDLTTLDEYCREKRIKHIDFLKIDTEGNDFFVLKGSRDLLDNGAIDIIQFEFNEMNVISRVFLKDFYDLLPQYEFYRMKDPDLFPLGNYSSSNEIFKLQNILAIRKTTF